MTRKQKARGLEGSLYSFQPTPKSTPYLLDQDIKYLVSTATQNPTAHLDAAKAFAHYKQGNSRDESFYKAVIQGLYKNPDKKYDGSRLRDARRKLHEKELLTNVQKPYQLHKPKPTDPEQRFYDRVAVAQHKKPDHPDRKYLTLEKMAKERMSEAQKQGNYLSLEQSLAGLIGGPERVYREAKDDTRSGGHALRILERSGYSSKRNITPIQMLQGGAKGYRKAA